LEVEPEEGKRHFYKVEQKIVSLRPVYEIYDEETGEKVAVARQTWLSFLRSTVNMEDPQANKILTAKGGFFDKTFHLLDPSGGKIAKITRPWIMWNKRFTMHYRDDEIHAQGGVMAWGFSAASHSGSFAFKLDKKVLSVRDQFRVEVGDYMDWRHAVASAIVVDRIFFKGKGCGCRFIVCFLFLALMVISLLSTLLMP